MKFEEMKTKEGVLMKTQNGEQMIKKTFEENDSFIPLWTKPKMEKKGNAVHPRYFIKVLLEEDNQEHIVDLTPSQYNSFMKKVEEEKPVYNEVFRAYSYVSETYDKECIGVGYEPKREPIKSFDELRNKENHDDLVPESISLDEI